MDGDVEVGVKIVQSSSTLPGACPNTPGNPRKRKQSHQKQPVLSRAQGALHTAIFMSLVDYKLIVSHSHSCGPVVPPGVIIGPCWLLPMATILWLIMGRCIMPKLLEDMPPGSDVMAGVLPRDRIPSLEPVDVFPGLSKSIAGDMSAPPLLLCLRWRFDDTFTTGRDMAEAPGPGVGFGGAAAIGITPFPPIPPADEPVLP